MKVTVADAPRFLEQDAVRLARELFDVEGAASPLPSERDQNFRITSADGSQFVLKIANATETEEILDFQNQAIEHLGAAAPILAIPRMRRAKSGRTIEGAVGPDGRAHLVRLLSWVPGACLAAVRPHSPELLGSLGRRLADMDLALADFSHPAMHRSLPWDLKHTAWIGRHVSRISGSARRGLIEDVVARFEASIGPALSTLRASVIHNDWNEFNVLVSVPPGPERKVVGAIDFGDMVHSATICDLAIAAAYAMLDKPDPVAASALVVGGYHEVLPLTDTELELLYDLILCRLCISAIMAIRQQELAPDNAYLRISESQISTLLDRLAALSPRWAYYSFRHACGRPPCPATAGVTSWLSRHPDRIGPVLAPDPKAARRLVFDLSVGSPETQNVADLQDTRAWTDTLFARMRASDADVGVGRYDEPRLAYRGERFEEPSNDGPEQRTIHLGVDLFVGPGAPVFAPLDGSIHSFRDNDAPLDYGPTLVLQHATDENGPVFYTLYGHLSRDSLGGLREGMAVRKGDRIATIGDSRVNGGWPPHLHFQLMTDLLGRRGDFPGVAAPSRRALWLSLSPDPNLILRIPDERLRAPAMAPEQILAARRRHIGPSVGLSYRKPLPIVRGHMQYLYDENARAFLDAVNNVAHVGHSHPRVVRAAREQMAVLNTNTRYLHEHLARYAERLAATLPEALSVCYFVSSGSEANELALRLARAHTRQTDLVVVDGAYHGNTGALVDISPYKFDGPGGSGAPPHVRNVPMPDVYRGPYRSGDGSAGARYAAHVRDAIDRIQAAGRGVAAFICESLMSCAGQIVLPGGYLAEAYHAVRAAGGVCIADEVQVGFGRVGTDFWGFETQGVTPDIVTMGKPIGNGHPLGAVACRREIAASFDNGMEYFSTFGGNPVSCAVGLAVLDVIRDERLQDHALRVGARLIGGLEGLKRAHALVGDVRGLGLFVGVELVLDRGTLAPAPRQAAYIIERMKDRGILLSTDGPLHNVLKIKPPMVFTEADADRLVATLDEVLKEDFAQA